MCTISCHQFSQLWKLQKSLVPRWKATSQILILCWKNAVFPKFWWRKFLPEEREMLERAIWPLKSTLICGEHIIQRCRELKISMVLYDPTAPHGLLVALKLDLPKASLVTFPGMGSLRDLMADEERLKMSSSIRAPLGRAVKETFGVDLQAELLTRRQWLAPMNFITTSADLVAPLPDTDWAKELRDFSFLPVGLLSFQHSSAHFVLRLQGRAFEA